MAFASGAEKIFHPGIMKKEGKSEPGKEDTYNALQTIVHKIDYFKSIEKINDSQYKFVLEENDVYVLWGEGIIPSEITGQVRKTEATGEESILNADDLIISENPVFIEMI
jgi:hypothetical protein